MQPALEQNSGAAEFQHFVDFLVNLLEREDVAILGAERPVEGAEGTILGAEIRVVDVAVDLVGDDAGVVLLQAHLVRGHADAHEVIGFEHVESLLFCHSQDVSSFRFRINVAKTLANSNERSRQLGRSMLRPYNFTASAFVAAHSSGFAWGIRPSFAAWAKYNSQPRRFSSSARKPMVCPKYHSHLRPAKSTPPP